MFIFKGYINKTITHSLQLKLLLKVKSNAKNFVHTDPRVVHALENPTSKF